MPTTPDTIHYVSPRGEVVDVTSNKHLADCLRQHTNSAAIRDEALARLIENLPGAHHRVTPQEASPGPGQPVSDSAPSTPTEQQESDGVSYSTPRLAEVLIERIRAHRDNANTVSRYQFFDNIIPILMTLSAIVKMDNRSVGTSS